MGRIVEIQFGRLQKLLEDRKITLTLDIAARDWLAAKGWDPAYGARPLKRVIQRNVQDPQWVEAVCQQARTEGGRWLIPRSFVLGRLASLHRQPLGHITRRAPVALAATLATLPAVLRANAILRRPAARLLW